MAGSEPVILRQPAQTTGKRRLPERTPGLQPAATASLAQLRELFAADLQLLKEEAWQQGMEAAQADSARALSEAQHAHTQRQAALLEAQQQALAQKAAAQAAQLAQAVTALDNGATQLLAHMPDVVGRLAYAALLKLLGRHQAQRPLVADLAAHAVEEYRLGSALRIRLSAGDHAAVLAVGAPSTLLGNLQVDPELAPGSCVIDYGLGMLDASLDRQLQALRRLLIPALAGDADAASL